MDDCGIQCPVRSDRRGANHLWKQCREIENGRAQCGNALDIANKLDRVAQPLLGMEQERFTS